MDRLMGTPEDLYLVSRIEVIDASGRAFVWYGDAGVSIQLQDDGRTLKVFAGERREN